MFTYGLVRDSLAADNLLAITVGDLSTTAVDELFSITTEGLPTTTMEDLSTIVVEDIRESIVHTGDTADPSIDSIPVTSRMRWEI